jgi:SAM-dependent methyltransferase
MLSRGSSYASRWNADAPETTLSPTAEPNPIHEYFKAHKSGPGIWKWDHYFEIYHRHFERFRGREVHVLEIGVYSGGSLAMWTDYFGPRCKVYGVDIAEACRAYDSESVKVFIGDQQDRAFWKSFREKVPVLDIVIDDGGHLPEQQLVTLEETLPHLRGGGVYLCEDICGTGNRFASYVSGLIAQLNAHDATFDLEDNERRNVATATPFQAAVHSVHCYPFVTVIEKRPEPVAEFVAPKRGTEWEPHLQ